MWRFITILIYSPPQSPFNGFMSDLPPTSPTSNNVMDARYPPHNREYV